MSKLTNLESIENDFSPATKDDRKIIVEYLVKKIELFIDELDHVITEGGVYIADLIEN